MEHSKLYVPNPQTWVQFFDRVAKGKVKMGQIGAGNVSRILPVEYDTCRQSEAEQLAVKVVSPAEQTVDQAKSELERENINLSKVRGMIQKAQRRRGRKTREKKKKKKIGKIIKKKRQTGGRKVKVQKRKKTKDIFQF